MRENVAKQHKNCTILSIIPHGHLSVPKSPRLISSDSNRESPIHTCFVSGAPCAIIYRNDRDARGAPRFMCVYKRETVAASSLSLGQTVPLTRLPRTPDVAAIRGAPLHEGIADPYRLSAATALLISSLYRRLAVLLLRPRGIVYRPLGVSRGQKKSSAIALHALR